jgi:hypothetical protein
MKYLLAGLAGILLLAAAPQANALVCGVGVYHAGCVGGVAPYGGYGYRSGYGYRGAYGMHGGAVYRGAGGRTVVHRAGGGTLYRR